MIALPLALLLLGQTAADPALVTLPRDEAPWVVVVAAAPASELGPADRLLFAALLETPEAWPAGGALLRAFERGARIDAEALPDGVLLRVEGHADDVDLLIEAARASRLLPRPTPRALARAQGRILRERAARRGQVSGDEAQWERWFGAGSPARAVEVSDIALHQITPARFWGRYEVWARGTAVQLFVQGRLPASVVGSEPALRAAAPALLPVVDEGGPTDVHGAVAAPMAVAAHPVPPSEATDDLADVVAEALRRTAPASDGSSPAPISVRVLATRRAALLVVQTPLGGRTPAQVLAHLQARLGEASTALDDRREGRAIRAHLGDHQAASLKSIGAGAERRALAWLTDQNLSIDAATTASGVLFPEALRLIVVHPYGADLPQ